MMGHMNGDGSKRSSVKGRYLLLGGQFFCGLLLALLAEESLVRGLGAVLALLAVVGAATLARANRVSPDQNG